MFDLRFIAVFIINIVKSHVGMPWEWDPFELTSDLTWIKFWVLTSLFFLFGFISVGMPLNKMGFVRIQITNFSPSLLACFLACLFIPQFLFWYVYPMILLSFLWYTWISNAFASFVLCVGAILSGMPDLDISIAATDGGVGGGDDDDDELNNRQVEEGAANLEPQV